MILTLEDVQAQLDHRDFRCPICTTKTRARMTRFPTKEWRIAKPLTPEMYRDAMIVECTDEDCNWANEITGAIGPPSKPVETSEVAPLSVFDPVALAWHDTVCPEGPECRSRNLHAASEPVYTSGMLQSFLGNLRPEDGERSNARGALVWLDREKWGVVFDALIEHEVSAEQRKGGNSESTSDVRAQMCIDIRTHLTGLLETLGEDEEQRG